MNLDAVGLMWLAGLGAAVLVVWPLAEHWNQRRRWRQRMSGRRMFAGEVTAEREERLRQRVREVLRAGGLIQR